MKVIKTRDFEGKPVFAIVINDFEISDAYISECGRFRVDPEYYGLTDAQAQTLKQLNNEVSK